MYTQQGRIAFDIQKRLWSLPAALEHLKSFVADRSGQAGKCVELQVACPDILVSQETIDAIVPTIAQLLRNAIEHGVESSVARLMARKPLTAIVALNVTIDGPRMIFSIVDDGEGMDAGTANTVRADLASGDDASAPAIVPSHAHLIRRGVFMSDTQERGASGLQRALMRTARFKGEITFSSDVGTGSSFDLSVVVPSTGDDDGSESRCAFVAARTPL